MKKRLFHFPIAMALFFALLLLGCSPEVEENTINIGVAGVFSGEMAPYGFSLPSTAQILVDEQNAKGGLLGRPIKLIVGDDQGTNEGAVEVAKTFVEEKVVGVIGHTFSKTTESALPIYNDSQIVTISPSSSLPSLTLSGEYPLFLRVIPNDKSQAELTVDFLLNTLNVERVVILHDKGDYGYNYANEVREGLNKSGLEVALFEGVGVAASRYSSIISRILAESPDILVWGGLHQPFEAILEKIYNDGVKIPPFIGSDTLKEALFVTSMRRITEKFYLIGSTDTTWRNAYQTAFRKYLATPFGEEYPGEFDRSDYVATQVLLQAIEGSGSTDSEKIVAFLKSKTFHTAIGEIGFDENGDITNYGYSIYPIVGKI